MIDTGNRFLDEVLHVINILIMILLLVSACLMMFMYSYSVGYEHKEAIMEGVKIGLDRAKYMW